MGVHFDATKGWIAQCKVNGKLVNRKGFRSKEQADAALALMRGGKILDGPTLRESVSHLPGSWVSPREAQRRSKLQQQYLERKRTKSI